MKEDIKQFNVKISIIVPVYNAEKYLGKCLDSIINQTYKNIEIILVNDGSTDDSEKICEKYAEKDKRIKLIQQENYGASAARNNGINYSKGEYITFVDSDDYINADMLNKMIHKIFKYHAEIVICGNSNFSQEQNLEYITPNYEEKVLSQEQAVQELLNEKIYFSTVWGKLYNKKFFEKYKFNEKTRIAEDLEILYKIFKISRKIVYIPDRLYYWNDRNDSLTKEKFNKSWEKEIKICASIIEDSKDNLQIQEYAIKRYVRINVTCINNIIKNHMKDKETLGLLRNNIKQYKNKYLKNNNVSMKNKVKFILAIYGQVILKLYFFIKKRK